MKTPTVKDFLLKKFPPSKYFDCPVPKHYWGVIQEYAELYGSYMKEQGREEGLSGGWIAVSERLPDFNVEVLVFGERAGTNPKMGGAYVSMTKRIDLKGTSFESRSQRLQCDNQFSQMAYATHWMPLPATPQPTDTNP